jgi:hypothetical protein
MIQGEAAQTIAQLWRQLPPGEQARCHIPPFALRFIADGVVICQGSVCWKCNNILGEVDGKRFWYAFDSDSDIAQSLLDECRRANLSATLERADGTKVEIPTPPSGRFTFEEIEKLIEGDGELRYVDAVLSVDVARALGVPDLPDTGLWGSLYFLRASTEGAGPPNRYIEMARRYNHQLNDNLAGVVVRGDVLMMDLWEGPAGLERHDG